MCFAFVVRTVSLPPSGGLRTGYVMFLKVSIGRQHTTYTVCWQRGLRSGVRPAGLELEAIVPLRMRCTTALSPMPSFTDAFLTFLPLLVQYRYNNGSNLKVFCGNRPDGEEQGWTWTRKIKCTGLEII